MTPYAANACDLCAELSPDVVIDYLTAKGYERLVIFDGLYSVYALPGEPMKDYADVPLNPALCDYGRRMHEALDALDGAFLGLLHAIDPARFPRERILALAGVTP